MIRKNSKLYVAIGLSLSLATVLGFFAYRSSAAGAGALMFVQGPIVATCEQTGQVVQGGYQGSNFGL